MALACYINSQTLGILDQSCCYGTVVHFSKPFPGEQGLAGASSNFFMYENFWDTYWVAHIFLLAGYPCDPTNNVRTPKNWIMLWK